MALDPNRWTAKTQEALRAAADLAQSRNNPEVAPEHLLAAMLGQEATITLPVLGKVGVAPLSLRNRNDEALAKLPRSYGGGSEPGLSRAATNLFNGPTDNGRPSATNTSRWSTSCWPWRTWSESRGTTCWPRSARCGEATGSPARTRRSSTRRSRSTAGI